MRKTLVNPGMEEHGPTAVKENVRSVDDSARLLPHLLELKKQGQYDQYHYKHSQAAVPLAGAEEARTDMTRTTSDTARLLSLLLELKKQGQI